MKPIIFEVGGRYRNRRGWYEVLEVKGDDLEVRYEMDGMLANLPIEIQTRIFLNMNREEKSVLPYENTSNNQKYFRTLGYLSKSCMIEAIIPPKSKIGFDSNYSRIKGHSPPKGHAGYYIHDNTVDKWGVEMRLTFTIPNSIEIDELDFGASVTIVKSPNPDELRINSNQFCYNLLKMGFDLGSTHNINAIENNVPERFRHDFQEGKAIT